MILNNASGFLRQNWRAIRALGLSAMLLLAIFIPASGMSGTIGAVWGGLVLLLLGTVAVLVLAYRRRERRHEKLKEMLKASQATADELRARCDTQRDTLADTGHELRAPLTGILGMAELLEKTRLDDRQRDYVDAIRRSANLLDHLIGDIMDATRLGAGRLRLEQQTLEPASWLRERAQVWEPQARAKNLEFDLEIDDDLPDEIETIPARLEQILNNLVTNAVKYTDAGGIRLSLKNGNGLGGQPTLRFEVADTGIGIGSAFQYSLFDRFAQEGASVETLKGAGLGLTIARELVTLLGGQLRFESQLGSGSCFWIEIPCGAPTTENAAMLPAAEGTAPADLPLSIEGEDNPMVLAVDDNDINRRLIGDLLAIMGCNAVVAASGDEALAQIDKYDFDLVLLDIHLGDENGVDVANTIRARLGDQVPPIIAVTAYAEPGADRKYLDVGFDDYLAKPLTVDRLGAALKTNLARRKSSSDDTVPCAVRV